MLKQRGPDAVLIEDCFKRENYTGARTLARTSPSPAAVVFNVRQGKRTLPVLRDKKVFDVRIQSHKSHVKRCVLHAGTIKNCVIPHV
jgi:hypothetical protein